MTKVETAWAAIEAAMVALADVKVGRAYVHPLGAWPTLTISEAQFKKLGGEQAAESHGFNHSYPGYAQVSLRKYRPLGDHA